MPLFDELHLGTNSTDKKAAIEKIFAYHKCKQKFKLHNRLFLCSPSTGYESMLLIYVPSSKCDKILWVWRNNKYDNFTEGIKQESLQIYNHQAHKKNEIDPNKPGKVKLGDFKMCSHYPKNRSGSAITK